jgi:hypothetical protein
MLETDINKLDNSWLDSTQAQFEAANDFLVLKTRVLLNRIVPDAPLHGRFLNTLSMLEHMGSRKIMATQQGARIDQATLKHVAEEAHHAYFMKRQAEKTAARPLEFRAADLLAPAAARMYFQRLEAGLVRTLGDESRLKPLPHRSMHATYLYMSLIVEFRALWFYRLYQQALTRFRSSLSLKRVLGEEQNHLGEVAQRLDDSGERTDARVETFLTLESLLYVRLLGALQRSLGAA